MEGLTTAARPMRADAARNRERILAAARVAFAEFGADAHMEAVASRAEVGVGTVYRHFPTKDDLMGEMVAQQFEAFADQVEVALERGGDPWEALADALRANAAMVAAHVGVQDALMGSDLDWTRCAPAQERLIALTSELIDRARAAGAVRDDLEVWDIPMIMCGVCSTMAQTQPGVNSPGWERHLELVLDGLRPR